MPSKRLPKDVIDQWPEVFKDVEVEVIPIEYLHSIRVTFSDGKMWDIALDKKSGDFDIETAITELIEEYEDFIINLDFRLDVEKVKFDIQNRTRSFLKKRK